MPDLSQMMQADPEEQKLYANFARNKQWAVPPPYQTPLAPQDERQFRSWVQGNKIPYDFNWPSNQAAQDYDMRGFWQAQQQGDPQARQAAANGHFPDTWKTPYHESFSAQSQYATPQAPNWQGNQLVDRAGNVVFQDQPR